jgi:hypothetical protein
MAITPPGTVELHTHQVLPIFQIRSARYVHPKKERLVFTRVSRMIIGTKAKNISQVNGETGQLAHSNKPLSTDKKRGLNFCTSKFLNKFAKNKEKGSGLTCNAVVTLTELYLRPQ